MHRIQRASDRSCQQQTSTIYKIASVLFWILIWFIASLLIKEELFLPSPFKTFEALLSLVRENSFWKSILFSLSRVTLGIVLSVALALVFAPLSYRFSFVESLLDPLLKTIKATPVASIVILVLLWIKSKNLSVVISFLMVFPVIYTSLLEGLKNISGDIIEMADVYKIKGFKRIRYIYIPLVMPFFKASSKTALAMGWKSAVAAEVIGLPAYSIGSELYSSKVYFDTPRLFAWTIVIIILSIIFEKFFLALLAFLERRLIK